MTTDELCRMLELAARACGAQIEPCVCSSHHNNDRNAALRLCALRVAAMIGEGME